MFVLGVMVDELFNASPLYKLIYCLFANQMIRRPERTDRVIVILPLRRIQFVLHHRRILADILQPPDPTRHIAFIVAAVPVGDQQTAVLIEDDVAGAEVRVLAPDERLAFDDVAALVGDEAEDAAVGAGVAVGAPVAQEQVALVFGGIGGGVVAHELRVGAAVQLLARRRERMVAGQPVVIDRAAAVTV